MKKKLLMFGLIGIFSIMLVAATLVPYLSNKTTGEIEVNSPITITVNGSETYSLELFAGESKEITSLTEIHIDGLTGHIAEIKIPDFDGIGITVDYEVEVYPGLIFGIPVCVIGNDSYFYIGDSTETLNKSSFESITTFNTAQNLDTQRTYDVETSVIMADEAICKPIPAPVTRSA